MTDSGAGALYHRDYYAWTKAQAAALRRLAERRSNLELDFENLAEEVESLGRSDLATVRSQVRRIVEHLLKLEYSPAAEPRWSWKESIIEARDVIEDVITPTLRRDVEAGFAKTYQQGRRRAETALKSYGEHAAAQALPTTCPYSLDQIATHDWFPDNRHGLSDEA